MESNTDLKITTFRIVFNNQLIELNYDPSFEEYKTVTIKSVIEKVLEKFGPKPLQKTSENYSLICSCGKIFNPDILISKSKCDHYNILNPAKNKNEKFLLVEKENKEQIPKNKNNDFLSNFDIAQILMQATGAKKIKNLKIFPESKNANFTISENLKKIIKELIEKKERGVKISQNGYDLKYSEDLYNELLTFGIEEKKIKAALRMTNNIKEDALLLATDPTFNIETRDYLFCENNQVLSNYEFMKKCKEEVKKEYTDLFEDDITSRTKMVIKMISKRNNNNNDESEELNQVSEIVEESSNHEFEDSEDDSFHLGNSDSVEHSSEI